MTARQPDHQGAKSSPRDGKHEVSIGKMVFRTSPVDAVRGFVFFVFETQWKKTYLSFQYNVWMMKETRI
jgi:hypothetical protein